MESVTHKKNWDWLAALLLYLTVLAYQGYQYGQGDQAQILPVMYALDHPNAYLSDHYVQAFLQSQVNERTVFQGLFRYLGYDQPVVVFIWHALFSLMLILAWIRIASLYVSQPVLHYISVALILVIGFHTSAGANELYYNLFIPSLVAKAIASWGIWYWLTEKHYSWSILLLIATFIQPLVGLQCFLFTMAGSVAFFAFGNKNSPIPWKAGLIYAVCSLPWIYLLGKYNGAHVQPGLFMEIMEYRLAHHFFAGYFGIQHLIIFCGFLLLCMFSYTGKLRWTFIAITLGCLIYETGVEMFHSPLILYSQWWKSTIWIEAFAFIAFAKWLEQKKPVQISKLHPLLFVSLFLLLVIAYRFTGIASEKPVLDPPWSASKSDAIDISEAALLHSQPEAIFIIPPELSAFRWYAQRSTYVDYKALFHEESFLNEWYNRIQDIYGYSIEEKRAGISVYNVANEALSHADPQTIAHWKSLGVSHVITRHPQNNSLRLLAVNNSYLLYEIP